MLHNDQWNPEVLPPLTPTVFHILLALADGEKHGYAIMREVGVSTGGVMHMGPGTLYGSIRRMLKDGLIAEAPERPDPVHGGERRRYYSLTHLGQRASQAEARRLEQLLHMARSKRVLPCFAASGGL